MAETQGWLSENGQRQFPFRSETLSMEGHVPGDLILDLKMFASSREIVPAYLDSLAYDDSTDSYSLTFCNADSGAALIQGTLPRLRDGSSRVGSKVSVGGGERVCLFTPGPGWGDPSWASAGSWSRQWSPSQSAIEQSLVNSGPRTLRQVAIEGEEIAIETDSFVVLFMGYNMEATTTSILGTGAISVDIDAGAGLGLGYPPAGDPDLYIATINGSGPDADGNLVLEGKDCLGVIQPYTDEGLIANTAQVVSNCAPCCSCKSYRNMFAAISRRAAKIRDRYDELVVIRNEIKNLYVEARADWEAKNGD